MKGWKQRDFERVNEMEGVRDLGKLTVKTIREPARPWWQRLIRRLRGHGYRDDRRVYEIEDGERHLVIATNPDEALELHAKSLGVTVAEHIEEVEDVTVSELRWEEYLTVNGGIDGDSGDVSMKARNWAKYPVGCLASTCY